MNDKIIKLLNISLNFFSFVYTFGFKRLTSFDKVRFREFRSAYHLNGIFGNSGANSNGTVHPGGKFSEKR